MWPWSSASLMMVLASAGSPPSFQIDPHGKARITEGRRQLEKFGGLTLHTKGCWTAAVENLANGCRSLDDDRRSRLAVQFTNCHLKKSGLPTHECTDDMPIHVCTKPMVVQSVNSLAFSVYTTFFTHAESMCFYLQSEAFQHAAEQAVDALHASATGTARQLGALHALATDLVDGTREVRTEQDRAMEAARSLVAGQERASTQLEQLHARQTEAFGSAERSLDQMRTLSLDALHKLGREAEAIRQKQQAVEGLLDRILDLQRLFLGEVGDVYTIGSYGGGLILALLLSSARSPFATARQPLLLSLLATAVSEKATAWLLSPARLGAMPETTWRWRWRVRKLGVATALYFLLSAFGRMLPVRGSSRRAARRQTVRLRPSPASIARRVRLHRSDEGEGPARDISLPSTGSNDGDGASDAEPIVVGIVGLTVAPPQSPGGDGPAPAPAAAGADEQTAADCSEEEEAEKGPSTLPPSRQTLPTTNATDGDPHQCTASVDMEAADEDVVQASEEEEEEEEKEKEKEKEKEEEKEVNVLEGAPATTTAIPEPPATKPPPPSGLAAVEPGAVEAVPRSTRSGRLVVKPQAFWAGAQVDRSPDGSYARAPDGRARLRREGVGKDFTAAFTGNSNIPRGKLAQAARRAAPASAHSS